MNQAIIPADMLVYGFVAQTFKPEDANNYFRLLLRTPPSQHFLQYYGIRYHQGAWAQSPGVPFHATPLLDYSNRATQGTVVPQRRWIPAGEVDIQRHVEDADLQLPIYFVNSNGSIGFPLPDILRGCVGNLHNANGFAPLGGRSTTHVRINWPGYRYWKRQFSTRDDTSARNPVTLKRFMKHVGTSVDKFLRECMAHGQTATDPRWQIGGHGGITQAEVKVIGAIHVSAGSWMPIIQLTRYVY
ncbi:hypothetical protein EDB92DRAFT_2004587 [Lactarius akahatsu]|uniref:Uncharacterized protein n=1 Tax=Lactarius akahatsu TaxID=416441 RepID=A0AAD4LEZ9_9AGAM|nr:hypothetical protein EDB92DRAFT_2004587 [Lactarius akahatsu]